MVVVVDSREQKPYSFDLLTMVSALPTGDYSLLGLEGIAAVERKELGDLINCATFQRPRFERELERSNSMKRLFVVVEGSLSQIDAGNYRSKANSNAILSSFIAWETRYDAVRFVFCENRKLAQKLTEKILFRFWKEFSGGTSKAGASTI